MKAAPPAAKAAPPAAKAAASAAVAAAPAAMAATPAVMAAPAALMTDSGAAAGPAEHPKYRADIDGLRAVAVLAVVGFHASPNGVQGGFVGVDIFFVISGFLISSIIFAQLHAGTFSYLDFYRRRVRRIFPALIVILVFSCLVGWFVLLSLEYRQLGKHVAAGAGFISNLVFRSESGYFDTAAITKPLLHLWSLGIEEQFYIAWPLILALLWRRERLRFGAIITIFAASFLWNVWTANTDPVGDFYTPQTRFWELAIGALLAYLCLFHPSTIGRYKNVQSVLGAALVVGGILITAKDVPFPGWWALIPTLGTALLLSAGPRAWFNRAILANPLAVWFGLISYPLYLWHWPLLSFSSIVTTPIRSVRIGAVIAAVALAWTTYRVVELPVRTSRRPQANFKLLLVLMTLIGGAGLIIFLNHGFPLRAAERRVSIFNARQLTWSHNLMPQCTHDVSPKAGFCLLYGDATHVTLAVIGDSTGNALTPGLAGVYASATEGVLNIGQGTCPPIRGLITTTTWGGAAAVHGQNCAEVVRDMYAYVLGHPSIKVVVLAFLARDLQLWGIPGVAPDAPIEQRLEAVERLFVADIAALRAAGKRVIVTFDMPFAPVGPASCLRPSWFTDRFTACTTIHTADLPDREPYQSLFARFFDQRDDVCVFRQSDLLIANDTLRMFDADGRLLMRDNHHVSDFGSAEMAALFKASACAAESSLIVR